MGHIPVGMEMFSAADEEQWKLIARHIQESDYYVVIVAHRYGSTTTEGVSYTEKEYDFAVSQGVPTLGFVISESASWPNSRVEAAALQQIKQFKTKVQQRPVAFWTSATDLYGRVAIALMKQFAVTPRPGWMRATEAIDPSVINELSRLSEENRRLRGELEQIRVNEPVADPPDLDEHVSLLVDVYGPRSPGGVEVIETRILEATWLDIFRAIGFDLIAGATDEHYLEASVGGSLVEMENQPDHFGRLNPDSARSLAVELMARGIIEVDKEEGRWVLWTLTRSGRAFFLAKRDMLL